MLQALLTHLLADVIGSLVPIRTVRPASVVLGVAAGAGTIAAALSDLDALALILAAAMALFLGAALVLSRPARRVEVRLVQHAGSKRLAYVVDLSRRKALIGGAITAAFTAVIVLLLAATYPLPLRSTSSDFELPWPVAAVALGGVAVGSALLAVISLADAIRGAYLAVIGEGVLLRTGLGSTFVPWQHVKEVALEEVEGYASHRFVAVQYTHDAAARTTGAVRAVTRVVGWMRLAPRTPGTLRVRGNMLTAPEADVMALLHLMHTDPAARDRVASPGAVRLTFGERSAP